MGEETPQTAPEGDEEKVTFGEVLTYLQTGPNKFARKGWNGKGMFIQLQVLDEHSKMGLPYIYMSTVDGKLVPWVASHTDMLADDWTPVS